MSKANLHSNVPGAPLTEPRDASLGISNRSGGNAGSRRDHALSRAFTLIELLVVISIIGVLAGLTVGLGGLATRKSKEARIRGEISKLINAIENYKASVGSYPPDHRDASQQFSIPSPNQLYYELSGTYYTNRQFCIPGRSEGLDATFITTSFGSAGFANAARDPRDIKFKEDFKASQVKRVINPLTSKEVDILASPVRGPASSAWNLQGSGMNKKEIVNPWLYVSTSPTNNAERFDLWTEVLINGKIIRFSNWEKDPVVLSR
jgi:prepilin-type N-terminal cleavage/methylation domain-containing protein